MTAVNNDVCRRVNRDVAMTTADESSSAAAGPDDDLCSSLADTAPKLDLAFKEGETIQINITVAAFLDLCLFFQLF